MSQGALVLSHDKMNPNAFHLLRYMKNPDIRSIILYGGSSSGKSYSVAQCILFFTVFEGSNHLVVRKVGTSIAKTIYEDFKVASRQLGISGLFRFKDSVRQIVCLANDAHIDFIGLDDEEKIKGLSNYKRVFLDEWSEYTEEDDKQVRKRLRGKEGQQKIQAFNPIKETHWIKRNVIDKETWHDVDMTIPGIKPEYTAVKSLRMNEEKRIYNPRTGEYDRHPSDMVLIQSTYLNNFWVVGSPDGKYGYYDRQCIADFERDRLHDPDYYNVYALGEWGVLHTGSEFFGSFNRGAHTSDVAYEPSLPVHISVDSNVLPYITITYWQVDTSEGVHVRQIGETLASSPNNTVRKAAKLVAARLRELDPERVFLHGDASTRAANNIDDEKRSFLDLFIDTLSKEGIEITDRVGSRNPSVAMSGEFMNAIFDGMLDGLQITIGNQCKESIEDYLAVQKDVNGAILKTKVKNKLTGQTYEEHGHISDTARYLVTDVMREEFLAFSNRRKRNLYARDGFIQFFNPDTECEYSADILYLIPNINGKASLVHGRKCGEKWHIVDALLMQTESTELIKSAVIERKASAIIVESQESYFPFIRNLRKEVRNVRAKKLTSDIPRRIAATSDLVRQKLLFNPSLAEESNDYGAFLTNLLDYGANAESIEAGACLSGFIEYAAKVDI